MKRYLFHLLIIVLVVLNAFGPNSTSGVALRKFLSQNETAPLTMTPPPVKESQFLRSTLIAEKSESSRFDRKWSFAITIFDEVDEAEMSQVLIEMMEPFVAKHPVGTWSYSLFPHASLVDGSITYIVIVTLKEETKSNVPKSESGSSAPKPIQPDTI